MKAKCLIVSVVFFIVVNTLAAKEVITLELNRAYYIPGDTIWFKASLFDSDAGYSNIRSNYIYFELLRDSVIARVKIKRDEKREKEDSKGGFEEGFSGYFPLRGDLPFGDYIVRAYTRFMLNEPPEELFFTKISIIKPNEPFYPARRDLEDDGRHSLSITDETTKKSNEYDKPKSYLKESFQYIEGWVENASGKKVNSYILDIFSPQTGFTRQATVENNIGNFLITELDTPVGTQYIIKATDLSGKKRYYPVCLPDTFPPYYDYLSLYKNEPIKISDSAESIDNANPVILYDTSGVIKLDAVNVVADRKQINGLYRPKINPSPFGNSFERRSVKEREDLKRDDHKTVLEYIVANYPSFFVINDYLYSRRSFTTKGSGGSPSHNKTIIYIDGVRFNDDDLEFPALRGMDIRDVETLIVLNGNEGLLYKSVSGVVLISTRRYRPGDSNFRPSLLIYTPLGYQ